MNARKRLGVVLFQLGGPDRPEAVEPFLYNLFCDPDIIDFPLAFLARRPLAKWISTRRSRVVRQHYAEIGGASPIRLLTERQAEALKTALEPHVEPHVVVAMRYWHPSTQEAIAALNGTPLDELVLLPLYPHYSLATTQSSFKEWNRLYRPGSAPVRVIEKFYDHPGYIAALVEKINLRLERLERPEAVHFVFSAHGLPMKLVERGDPYPQQVEATIELVMQRGGWPNRHTLCYQSRVGRQKWLAPSLTETMAQLAGEGARRLFVAPISFVTEHVETLHEINIEARHEAASLGIEEFHMMPALNDSALFIRALADLVLHSAGIAHSF